MSVAVPVRLRGCARVLASISVHVRASMRVPTFVACVGGDSLEGLKGGFFGGCLGVHVSMRKSYGCGWRCVRVHARACVLVRAFLHVREHAAR
eukprot:4533900-Pleurochrysis_carterae.AAC.5